MVVNQLRSLGKYLKLKLLSLYMCNSSFQFLCRFRTPELGIDLQILQQGQQKVKGEEVELSEKASHSLQFVIWKTYCIQAMMRNIIIDLQQFCKYYNSFHKVYVYRVYVYIVYVQSVRVYSVYMQSVLIQSVRIQCIYVECTYIVYICRVYVYIV